MYIFLFYLLNPLISFIFLSLLIYIQTIFKIELLFHLFDESIDLKAIVSAFFLSTIFSSIIPLYIYSKHKIPRLYLTGSILFSGFIAGSLVIIFIFLFILGLSISILEG